MKTFSPMAFRLGSPTSTPVPPESEFFQFYQYVAQSVAGTECLPVDDDYWSTIPFDNSLILDKPYLIHQRFLDYVGQWKTWPNIVVVDLTNNLEQSIDRGGVLINIGQAIQYCFDVIIKKSDTERPVFVILVPVLPPEMDLIQQILKPHFLNGSVLMISDDGNTISSSNTFDAAFPAQYRLSLASVQKDPRRRAKVKLIRRLGHFKRGGSTTPHSGCMRYAYDGSLCVGELAELLKKRIELERRAADGSRPLIIYYGPSSHWLEETVAAVGVEMGLDYCRIDEIRTNKIASVLSPETSALLVVPMVDSGQTLAEALIELVSLPVPIKPKVISILCTRVTNPERRTRVIKIHNQTITLEYMLEVAQESYSPGDCPMCDLNIPESSYDHDEFTMLTTYDMWDMADRAGWKAEDDVPVNRLPIPLVPDYPKLIEEHGAWLMSKVRQRLEELPAGFPADPLVICPREQGSIVFTDYLTLVLKVTFVRVPREVINIAKLGKEAIKEHSVEWEVMRPDWYVQLSTVATQDIIVMDEFNVSGETRAGLTTLLRYFSISPLCYFSFVDFNPEQSRDLKVSALSLYDFQAYQASVEPMT